MEYPKTDHFHRSLGAMRPSFSDPAISKPFLLPVLFSIIIMAGGCRGGENGSPSTTPPGAVPLSALKLAPSAGCDPLKQYIAEVLIARYTAKAPPSSCPDCPAPVPDAAGGTTAIPSAPPDAATTTNLQEEGVDEADLVKVDAAGRLYIVNGGFLVIEKDFLPKSWRSSPVSSWISSPAGSTWTNRGIGS